ncbi:17670_t:CDS:1, partial [Cetraspora pellucida]
QTLSQLAACGVIEKNLIPSNCKYGGLIVHVFYQLKAESIFDKKGALNGF